MSRASYIMQKRIRIDVQTSIQPVLDGEPLSDFSVEEMRFKTIRQGLQLARKSSDLWLGFSIPELREAQALAWTRLIAAKK